MKRKMTPAVLMALLGLSAVSGTAAFAQAQVTEDPKAEAQAFLGSQTSMSAAIAAAETASGGKVSGIEYNVGENGGPDLITADVLMADGSEKTVTVNPADGKVMSVKDAAQESANDEQDEGGDGENSEGADGQNEGGGEDGSEGTGN